MLRRTAIDEIGTPAANGTYADPWQWNTEFEDEVEHVRAALSRAPDDVPMIDAVRHAVVSANHYRAAYDRWAVRADNDLTVYLDAVLTALGCGFAPEFVHTMRPAR
ncbi:MAG TPA: hypothetical protein VF060_08090 [Trebonia sp.]